MLHTQAVALVIALSLAAAWSPARVHACSCSPAALYHSQPGDGATNVPRDIAPVLEGPFDPTQITFEDEHGAKPKFELHVGPRIGCLGGWAELLPQQPLAANTRYTIRVVSLYADGLPVNERTATVSFTTGSDELADESLAPPQLTAASILLGAPDCGGAQVAITCIGGLERQRPKDHELIAKRGDKTLLRITTFIENDNNYALEEQPDCIELRRRAVDGRRSEPTKICGDALLTRNFQQSDKASSGWVACKDGILGDADAYVTDADGGTPEASVATDSEHDDAGSQAKPDAGHAAAAGCSVRAGRSSPPQILLVACAVLIGAWRRRRR